MNVLSVCSGVGASDLGLRLAVGKQHRTVMYIEREAYAAACLVARMEEERLDKAPIWDDLESFKGGEFRGVVDLVSAGLPCQPYSTAGKLRANSDERALWPRFVSVVGETEPAFVFLENTPGFLKHAEPFWRELQNLGFEWAPPLLQDAHSFGAPHRRRRLFLLAAHPQRVQLWQQSGGSCRPTWRARAALSCRDGFPFAHPHGGGCKGEWSGWLFDSERETFRHDPDRCGMWCRICGSPWETKSPVLRVDHGPANRVDRLRAVGNVGAPPIAYAAAFLSLIQAFVEIEV